MSKIVKSVTGQRKAGRSGATENFMGGISYKYDPIETLKMVTASSIFGEPQYYRDGEFAPAGLRDELYEPDELFEPYSILSDEYKGLNTSEIMERIIDKALDHDFKAVLEWAVTLRKDYLMRLNPQVIMVRAAIHPKRVAFNEKEKGFFSKIQKEIMQRADEPASQLAYYLYKNGSKKNVPNLLKRSWASRLEKASLYELYKYKNSGVGMIDTIRICHANSPLIDELMRTGTLKVEDDNSTWEAKRAAKTPWKEILSTVKTGHMALLRNLRGIFREIDDEQLCKDVLAQLRDGVRGGRQFPFRYFTAYKIISKCEDIHHKAWILDALEECIDTACDNMPKLRGKTMCLSDNSGSAWGSFDSEFGTVTVAEIDNLSSVITARNSEEGYVGKFGDKLIVKPVIKRNGILSQCDDITKTKYNDVGASTENGIWLFFRDAIDKKEHWDNIFIYSDQQAGHGGLYGTDKGKEEYTARGFAVYSFRYVDAAKLINEYRAKVNPKVNVFSVQTAGYDNTVIPEYGYRTNLLYGWTGKELSFADTMIKFWDEKDNREKGGQ